MLNFEQIDFKKDARILNYLNNQDFRICDYTPLTIFMWQDFFKCRYAIKDDFLFLKNIYDENNLVFSFPVGNGNIRVALDYLVNYAKEKERPLKFGLVPKSGLKILQEYFADKLEFTTTLGNADYLYLASDLMNLEGSNYRNQRNRINKFIRTFGQYEYHPISKEVIPRLKKFMEVYLNTHNGSGELFLYENQKTIEVLDNYDQFDLIGGYVSVNDQIIGFTIGEIIKDTLYMHIEKALAFYAGAYQVVNNSFVINSVTPQVKYVNLEEDMGDEGLRKSKMSYNPHIMLEKYNITIL